jgi:hypothetical protein
MADLGLSGASGRLDDSSARRRLAATSSLSSRRKWETALHVALFAAAFVFVAAIVCGVGV